MRESVRGFDQRQQEASAIMSDGLIVLDRVTKRFGPAGAGGILAVDGVSFAVPPGEVLGFLGPNGAGKSTTMKMVTGYLTPTSGRVRVDGVDVSEQPLAAKAALGYLPEGAPLYGDMTPEGFLRFVARARGLRGDAARRAVADAVDATNLSAVLRQNIDTLSKGFKRRVGLAQAILHQPKALVLDEPTDGLDPNQKREVRGLITSMARDLGRAVVLSTHILEEVSAVCTRVVMIARGRIVADCTPDALLARSKHHNAVTISLVPPPGTMLFDELARVPGVRTVEDGGRRTTPDGVEVTCTLIAQPGAVVAPAVSHLVRERGWQVSSMRLESGRLDDVFRELTT
jgi:ABC-2 type transport system ATP-binding protein